MKSDYFESLNFNSNISAIDLMNFNNVFPKIKINDSLDINIEDLDASMFDFPNKIWTVRPLWEVVVEIVLYVPILIGGVISNITLLTMIVKYKRLQSPTNILIAFMAGVDLVNLILCPWMLSVHHFYQNYVLGAVGCKMEAFLSASLLITGVMLLSIVSYDRLTAIVLPREKRLTKRGAYQLAILSILIGIAFGTPFLVLRYYKERQWKNFLEKYCTEDVQILPIYWHVLLSTLVWLPMTVMISCYTAIFCKLDNYQKEILRREHPMSVNYKTRVARTLFVIVISFIVCRLPFTVLVFWRFQLVKETRLDSITSTYQMLWFMSHYLIYLNCAINPMIYGFNNENYKRAFGETQLYKWLSGSKQIKEVAKAQKIETDPLDSDKKSKCCLCCLRCTRQKDEIKHETNIRTISDLEQKKSDPKLLQMNYIINNN